MKKWLIAICLVGTSGLAFAHGCPGEMKKIDSALLATQLTPQNMTKVKDLRAKGEDLHKAGKHTESMAALAEAKKIIGIQ
jgi:hypothetical protein